MNLDKQELKQLANLTLEAKHKNTLQFNNKEYDYQTCNKLLRDELNDLIGGKNFKISHNRELAYELIAETVTEVLPKNISKALNMFADIQVLAHGDKAVFTRKKGALRGRNFVSQVTPAGLYETFKLDREQFEVSTKAYGAAARVELFEFLEGRVDFAELIDIITLGFEDVIYREILRVLTALKSNTVLPANNIRTVNGFSNTQMTALVNISSAYGTPTIFCSRAFASAMKVDPLMATEEQKREFAENGYIGTYAGANVVVLPESFWDTANTTAVATLPQELAWVLPAGQEKPVKIVIEGETQIKEIENDDWSTEIHYFHMLGVAMISNPGICIYENDALKNFYEAKGTRIKEEENKDVTPTYVKAI